MSFQIGDWVKVKNHAVAYPGRCGKIIASGSPFKNAVDVAFENDNYGPACTHSYWEDQLVHDAVTKIDPFKVVVDPNVPVNRFPAKLLDFELMATEEWQDPGYWVYCSKCTNSLSVEMHATDPAMHKFRHGSGFGLSIAHCGQSWLLGDLRRLPPSSIASAFYIKIAEQDFQTSAEILAWVNDGVSQYTTFRKATKEELDQRHRDFLEHRRKTLRSS